MTQTELAGRYRLDEVVGAGGMGRVWRARDLVLGRTVAVKEIRPAPWLPGGDAWQTTLREARAASRLRHPNVVAVLDVLRTDRSWIVMEYVPGRSLHDVVAERGPLDPPEVARLGLEILAALEAAHDAGIIHRDVKPQNVLLADDGRVVLTDFGLAVVADGGVTVPDQVLGSADFVAPECALTGASTVAGDLWSIGATLYALVEGRAPFHRPTVVATLTALAAGPPDPMFRAGPLAPVILRLLDRDPRRRPDAAALRARLQTAGEPAPRSRLGWRAAVAGVAALALATAGTAAAVTQKPPPPAVHPSPSGTATPTPTQRGDDPRFRPVGAGTPTTPTGRATSRRSGSS
ncbi:serine/threonine-protein kinase [Asanoa sp. WMMD1127]|uniref:serine/threonine-protein kinase n=1 Tax=Asanoa sp. WMMD1127 TaxID=3016107 RepID=UPI002417D049|nr:serine/threonine-protein kinase [Asanoa sp. WMMD1127]MDG4824867.1 serine/threonine-protein kinase [Asanoa sp. WMMD1127]